MDRIDGILSCELGLLLNFGARKVEVRRKVTQLRERPVYPVNPVKKGMSFQKDLCALRGLRGEMVNMSPYL